MESLSKKINILKKNIVSKEEEDKKRRGKIKSVLEEIFKDIKIPMKYIRDFYFRGSKLFIVTSNKSFASEIFLRKSELLELFKELGIKDLIVK